MIGNITLGKVFSGCIDYCMKDKTDLTEEEKIELSIKENLQHKDRAEVLLYNNCFGTAKELTKQFLEVRNLSSRTEKPVMHISLRLAPGETLSKGQLTEIAQACAEEFKFDQNQYVCVLHKDTREPHIHIVVNRVGYDGRAVNLSNNYRKMADFCRRMEQKYALKQVLNPRKFLPKEQRLLPRNDIRKETLRKNIHNTLQRVTTYDRFESEMKLLGYQVLKGRGISFIDEKKVKVKGSEVGFSLSKIEQILALRQKMDMVPQEEKALAKMLQDYQPGRAFTASRRLLQETYIAAQWENFQKTSYYQMQQALVNLLFGEQHAEQYDQSVNPYLLREARKKKKRHRHRL